MDLTTGRRRAYLTVSAGLIAATSFTLALILAVTPSGFPGHLACWGSSSGLAALHLTGDFLTWGAYTAIPFLLLYLMVAGRVGWSAEYAFPALIGWGAMFVWCCGQTHLLDALEVWWEVQWARGFTKLLTGVVSWVFVLQLLRQRLKLLSIARAIYRAAAEEEAALVEAAVAARLKEKGS